MDLELPVNQGEGLSAVLDRAMSGGICFAITSQWAFLLLKGLSYETEIVTCRTFKNQKNQADFTAMIEKDKSITVQKGFFTLVSLQRGYDLVDLLLADKMDAAQQNSFFKTASEFSQKYLASLCRTEGSKIQPMQTYKSADEVADSLSFSAGTVELIGIFGVENGKNWGHVVGTALGKQPLFFDANAGQYRGTTGAIKKDIAAHLKLYDGIQNCAKFTITK